MIEPDLNFVELDKNELENTEFYKLYKKLSFNGGFILKRISTDPRDILERKINALDLRRDDNIKMNSHADVCSEVNDFVFLLLTNKSIIDKNWRYEDDKFFTFIEEEYNSIEKFRNIGLMEITIDQLRNEFFYLARAGSVYDGIDKGEKELKSITNAFFNTLISLNPIKGILKATQPWGLFNIGFFECIFILSSNEIIIFAKDDYD